MAFPHDVPCGTWINKYGEQIRLCDMSERYIKNCMRFVGEDDPWYSYFNDELKRRENE